MSRYNKFWYPSNMTYFYMKITIVAEFPNFSLYSSAFGLFAIFFNVEGEVKFMVGFGRTLTVLTGSEKQSSEVHVCRGRW